MYGSRSVRGDTGAVTLSDYACVAKDLTDWFVCGLVVFVFLCLLW